MDIAKSVHLNNAKVVKEILSRSIQIMGNVGDNSITIKDKLEMGVKHPLLDSDLVPDSKGPKDLESFSCGHLGAFESEKSFREWLPKFTVTNNKIFCSACQCIFACLHLMGPFFDFIEKPSLKESISRLLYKNNEDKWTCKHCKAAISLVEEGDELLKLFNGVEKYQSEYKEVANQMKNAQHLINKLLQLLNFEIPAGAEILHTKRLMALLYSLYPTFMSKDMIDLNELFGVLNGIMVTIHCRYLSQLSTLFDLPTQYEEAVYMMTMQYERGGMFLKENLVKDKFLHYLKTTFDDLKTKDPEGKEFLSPFKIFVSEFYSDVNHIQAKRVTSPNISSCVDIIPMLRAQNIEINKKKDKGEIVSMDEILSETSHLHQFFNNKCIECHKKRTECRAEKKIAKDVYINAHMLIEFLKNNCLIGNTHEYGEGVCKKCKLPPVVSLENAVQYIKKHGFPLKTKMNPLGELMPKEEDESFEAPNFKEINSGGKKNALDDFANMLQEGELINIKEISPFGLATLAMNLYSICVNSLKKLGVMGTYKTFLIKYKKYLEDLILSPHHIKKDELLKNMKLFFHHVGNAPFSRVHTALPIKQLRDPANYLLYKIHCNPVVVGNIIQLVELLNNKERGEIIEKGEIIESVDLPNEDIVSDDEYIDLEVEVED